MSREQLLCLFQLGDKVLILLPVPVSTLSTRFSGPYVVESKLSDTNYIIKTPDWRRQTRVCHVNMMKLYHSRENGKGPPTTKTVSPMASLSEVMTSAAADGLEVILRYCLICLTICLISMVTRILTSQNSYMTFQAFSVIFPSRLQSSHMTSF